VVCPPSGIAQTISVEVASLGVRFGRDASCRARVLRPILFQAILLAFPQLLVHRFWMMADEELLAATVAPKGSHLLKADGSFTATLFYGHGLHVLILDHIDC